MAAVFEKKVPMGPVVKLKEAKKIEETDVIKNRVIRAGCCLKPKQPEDLNVLARALGDYNQFFANPGQKAY